MPLVNIRLTRREKPTTREQKAALIAGVTQLMQDVLDKRRDSVVVIIDEVDPDNWGEGGDSVTVLRERRARQGQQQ
ncbi:4-oxalocrotonate tautomerase [Rhodoferax koreense]|uniref:Tautomerase n=1 Tax=Rhodoferax koreensis TaxID=1842727 RepID=A0A1P8JXJ0_9BURK|nr:4-oxalocrotonate tautomerase family protein [Rhodoferax koreense]APW38411.1 4-oxalocrotonate tautomerase [Rhodoferax koreense]